MSKRDPHDERDAPRSLTTATDIERAIADRMVGEVVAEVAGGRGGRADGGRDGGRYGRGDGGRGGRGDGGGDDR